MYSSAQGLHLYCYISSRKIVHDNWKVFVTLSGTETSKRTSIIIMVIMAAATVPHHTNSKLSIDSFEQFHSYLKNLNKTYSIPIAMAELKLTT